MSSLEEVYDEGGRRWTVVRATLLLAGSLVAVIGFVSATASLVAGFGLGTSGALKVATLLGGALLLGGFLVLFARGPTTGPSRLLASVGTTFGIVGLALFWTTLPVGWTGHVAELPTLAAVTYATGLLTVFAAGFAGEFDAVESEATEQSADARNSGVGTSDMPAGAPDSDSIGSVETMMTDPNDPNSSSSPSTSPSSTLPSSAVGDGGAEEEDLEFFDDDG
jgi:hypothetical protein